MTTVSTVDVTKYRLLISIVPSITISSDRVRCACVLCPQTAPPHRHCGLHHHPITVVIPMTTTISITTISSRAIISITILVSSVSGQDSEPPAHSAGIPTAPGSSPSASRQHCHADHGSKHVKSMPGPQRWLFLAEVREGASEQDLREGTPCELPSPPAHPLTFMDVAKDVQPWLDSPLDRVEQLHTAHTLHLLGDPV